MPILNQKSWADKRVQEWYDSVFGTETKRDYQQNALDYDLPICVAIIRKKVVIKVPTPLDKATFLGLDHEEQKRIARVLNGDIVGCNALMEHLPVLGYQAPKKLDDQWELFVCVANCCDVCCQD